MVGQGKFRELSGNLKFGGGPGISGGGCFCKLFKIYSEVFT